LALNARSISFVEEFIDIVTHGIAENRASGAHTPAKEAALPEQLHQIAMEILRMTTKLNGPMPPAVAQFVERHRLSST
jgi:hypothetical protein